MGADCCAGDPSQSKITTNMEAISMEEEGVVTETEESRDSGEEQRDTISANKEQARDDSHLNAPITQNTEESLNVPSTLSAIESDHDPVPHSDYEENTEQYVVKQENNNTNKEDDDITDNRENTQDDNDENHTNVHENIDNAPIEEAVEDVKEDRDANKDKEDNIKHEDEAPPKAEDATDENTTKKAKSANAEQQITILQNEDLKQRSIELVTANEREFVRFLKKVLESKLREKIWLRVDKNNTGTVETDRFMYFWTLPVTLFKVSVYQRKHATKEKPKLNPKQMKKNFRHLAYWIIMRFGEKQEDGSYAFTLTKDNYNKDIVSYVEAYADCNGELTIV